MKITVEVKKKQFTDKTGKKIEFFDLSTEFGGETVKIKLDKDKNELFKHFLGKMNIPLESDDEKEVLMKRLLAGEKLTADEKEKLRVLLEEEGGEE